MKEKALVGVSVVIAVIALADIARAEASEQRTIRVPGSLGANATSEGQPGGTAATGFEYESAHAVARVRANFGISSYTLHNEAPKSYGNMVLQPDTRGTSFAADAAYLWNASSSNSDLRLGLGAAFRASPPLVTWSFDESVNDATTGKATIVTRSLSVTTIALVAGGALNWSYSELKELPISLGVTAGFSLRAITGDLDDKVLLGTIGTTAKAFVGGELRLKFGLGDVHGFASMPILWSTSGGSAVQGLTGVRFLFGAEVNGRIFERTYDGATRSSPPPLPVVGEVEVPPLPPIPAVGALGTPALPPRVVEPPAPPPPPPPAPPVRRAPLPRMDL